MKFKNCLPAMAVAISVFVSVSCSFVYHRIINNANDALEISGIDEFRSKNVFIGVANSETNSLDVSAVARFNPNDNSVKTIFIPTDTKVEIATSDQMFKEVTNIGGTEIIRDVLSKIIPLDIDYHLIIKSNELYDSGTDYESVIRSILSNDLWIQKDLGQYINQLLSLSSTDLTLIKQDEYVEFINKFSSHTNEFYSLPGKHTEISGRNFFVADVNAVNELINIEILG